jgi:peptide/nickel transport system substrate-binding protein
MLDAAGIRRDKDGMRRLPNGERFEIGVNCVAGWSDWIVAAQIIVRDFQELGIDASLNTYGFSAWFQRLRTGDYDLSMSWSSGDDTPYGFYRRQMSKSTLKPLGETSDLNWQRFSDARVDELLSEFERTLDEKRRHELSDAMQMRFVELAPSIPLFLGNAFGEYNTQRFTGFPTQANPYAPLSPHKIAGLPNYALVLKELEPR